MVFNLYAANCDDHTKNQSFLMAADGTWQLSPAYDITHAHNPAPSSWTVQHQMSVNGRFTGISDNDVATVADRHAIPGWREIIDQVRTAVSKWPEFAAQMVAHERDGARLALALRRLENSGELGADHALTTRAWLRDRCRMTDQMAGRWVAQGRFLDRFDTLAELALSGAVSAGQVDTVRAFCPTKLQPVMDEQHREILPLLAALDAEGTFEGEDDHRTKSERMADALHDIVAFYNQHNEKPTTKRRHPHVELSLEGDTLTTELLLGAHPDTGRLFDHATTETVLCDCLIHQIMLGTDSLPIGYGRARYSVPRHLFRLTAQRDGGCRFPGCDRPVSYCDAHHLFHWRKGGFTDHDNLGLLCNRHHHIVHREAIQVKLLPNADMHFTWPDGRHRETHPRGRPPRTRPPSPPV